MKLYRRDDAQKSGCADEKTRPTGPCFFMEATPRLELGVELLQSSALPLGYVAAFKVYAGVTWMFPFFITTAKPL